MQDAPSWISINFFCCCSCVCVCEEFSSFFSILCLQPEKWVQRNQSEVESHTWLVVQSANQSTFRDFNVRFIVWVRMCVCVCKLTANKLNIIWKRLIWPEQIKTERRRKKRLAINFNLKWWIEENKLKMAKIKFLAKDWNRKGGKSVTKHMLPYTRHTRAKLTFVTCLTLFSEQWNCFCFFFSFLFWQQLINDFCRALWNVISTISKTKKMMSIC